MKRLRYFHTIYQLTFIIDNDNNNNYTTIDTQHNPLIYPN